MSKLLAGSAPWTATGGLIGEARAVGDEAVAAWARWADEACALLDGGPRPAGACLADFARASWFLWVGAGLRTGERLSRPGLAWLAELLPAVAARAAWGARALVLGTVALDIYTGYLALRERARLWPALVGPAEWEAEHRRGASRALDTAVALGGVLIKGAQFAATRPDLLPPAYVAQFTALQDRVPPHPWPAIEMAIVHSLGGRPLHEAFAAVEQEPIAAASLAQVHRARLRDGRPVALKVRYPEIPALVAADLSALDQVGRLLASVEPTVDLAPILAYLRSTLPLELDLRREAQAMGGLRSALAHRGDVLIPAVVEELSGEALLVMELVEGIKVTDLDGLAAAGIDRRAVARLLNDVYAEQMLRWGVLHGDPHPGNLLVQPGPRLVLLDHGLTVELAPGLVDALRRLVRALAALDFEALAEALAAVGVAPGDAGATLPLLQLAGALGAERLALSSSWRLLGSALGRLSEDLVLIGRALALLDGITQTLDRELDTMAIVRQYA